MAITEERTGKFVITRVKNKSNDNYRTIAKDADDKQVGSTFDEAIADKLAAYPEGAEITLTLDKSGRFWDIVDARLADEGDHSSARAEKKTTSGSRPTFDNDALTYFMGNSARVVAAYVQSSSEYRDKIEDSDDPIEALHKDVVFGAKLLMSEANKG
jgi:hypothetical protein